MKETLQKINMLQRVKWPRGHYHPSFLMKMKQAVLDGKEINTNSISLIQRSFAKYFPGGVSYE